MIHQAIEITQLTCVCLESDFTRISSTVSLLIEQHQLPIQCDWHHVSTLNNKALKQLSLTKSEHGNHAFLITELDDARNIIATLHHTPQDNHNHKHQPSIIPPHDKDAECEGNSESFNIAQPSDSVKPRNAKKPHKEQKASRNNKQPMKVRLDWHKMQRRVVTAGKKSELLLQACKLSVDSNVIDATAGFGHDSLILASTLSADTATVTMIEKNPIMVLLLMLEKQRMQATQNWQALMERLNIYYADLLHLPQELQEKIAGADIVYLDPMFPHDSYEGAKVGKGMQVLHQLAKPPQSKEEQALLVVAHSLVNDTGRVVVKRPKNAPYLANQATDESWENDAVRFDAYLGNNV